MKGLGEEEPAKKTEEQQPLEKKRECYVLKAKTGKPTKKTSAEPTTLSGMLRGIVTTGNMGFLKTLTRALSPS